MNSQSILSTATPPSSSAAKADRGAASNATSAAEEPSNRLFSNELDSAVEVVSGETAGGASVNSGAVTDNASDELAMLESGQALAANGKDLPLLLTAEQGEGATAVAGDEPLAATLADAASSIQPVATDVNPLTPAALNVTAVDAVARQAVVTTVVPLNANNGQPLAQRNQPNLTANGENLIVADGVESVVDKSAKSDQLLAELSRNLRQSLGAARSGEAPATVTSGQFSIDSGLSAFQVASAAARDATPTSSALPRFMSTMETPFNDPRWQGDFSNRIALFAKSGIQQAEIKMNPAHLGPIDIRISMNDEQQASITFVAKNAAVREAIEASMPRLREMLNGQGMDLADSGVSEHAFNEQQEQAFRQSDELPSAGDASRDEGPESEGFVTGLVPDAEVRVLADGSRAVDFYA